MHSGPAILPDNLVSMTKNVAVKRWPAVEISVPRHWRVEDPPPSHHQGYRLAPSPIHASNADMVACGALNSVVDLKQPRVLLHQNWAWPEGIGIGID